MGHPAMSTALPAQVREFLVDARRPQNTITRLAAIRTSMMRW